MSRGKVRVFYAFRIAAIFSLVFFYIQPLSAQSGATEKSFSAELAAWQQILDRTRKQVSRHKTTVEGRALLREQAKYVIDRAVASARKEREKLKSLKELSAALGPPPKKGEPRESGDIARKRRSLARSISKLENRIKQADFIAARASDTLQEIISNNRNQLWDRLLTPKVSPTSPKAWLKAIPEFLKIMFRFVEAPTEWISSGVLLEKWRGFVAAIAIAIGFSGLIGWWLRKWLLSRFGRDPSISDPSYTRRLYSSVAEGIARGLLPSLCALAFVMVMNSAELLTGIFADLVIAVVSNVILFIIVSAVVHAVMAPDNPDWRVSRFTDQSSRMITRRMIALAGMFAITNTIAATAESFTVSPELDSLFSFVFGGLNAALILSLMQKKVWQLAPVEAGHEADLLPASTSETIWPRLRTLATLMVIAAPAAGLFGYTDLTKYMLLNLIISGLMLGGFILVRGLMQEIIVLLLNKMPGAADKPGAPDKEGEQANGTLKFLVSLSLDVMLFLIGGMLILSVWGMPPEDVIFWVSGVMRGVAVGSHTFSIADLLIAIATFVIVMAITRTIQWFLAERILPQTRLDTGVSHSIKTAVGYVGLLIALAMAISAIGLDLSNIALVASALSVGIGFGLQNVVSNFVSGLILLIERPIKAGDWIVVGSNEGMVRRINVRATEITTFQNASVIVPNAEILSNAVTNWTHKDIQGRIDIQVGISYTADPENACAVLVECAKKHPEVLSFPRPKALLMNFGDSSQDLELRVFIRRIEMRYHVASDLRIAIWKALGEAGIEIPFPQRVVHLAGAADLPVNTEK